MNLNVTSSEELFDVLDRAGRQTGETKPRKLVHRDGDWHRAFHCWVIVSTGQPEPSVIIQRRGSMKDTWPDRLDVSVGGHFAAGEVLADVIREMDEEIGQVAPITELRLLGTRISIGGHRAGVLDNEFQDVYLWQTALPFDAFRPNPDEVAAIELITIRELVALITGTDAEVQTHVRLPDGTNRRGKIIANDFIPSPDQYVRRAAIAMDLAIRGYPHPAI